jgi:glycogen synthase
VKILVISSRYPPHSSGGAERSTAHLVSDLESLGHSVSVLTIASNEVILTTSGGCRTSTRYRGLEGGSNPVSHPYQVFRKAFWHSLDIFDPRSYFLVRRILRETQHDVVMTHLLVGFSVSVWAAAHSLRVPIIHTARDYYLLCRSSSLCKSSGPGEPCRRVLCRIQRSVSRYAIRWLHAFVALSEAHLSVHQRQLPISRMSVTAVIAPGVACEPQTQVAVSEPRTGVRLGYLGRLSQEKGVIRLVEAFDARAEPNAMLLMAGNGPLLMGLKSEYSNSETITFLGEVDSGDFLRSVDILMVPSTWVEPFGRIVAEAAIMGVPSVCFEGGGPAEQVRRFRCGAVVSESFDELLGRAMEMGGNPSELRLVRNGCIRYADFLETYSVGAEYARLIEALRIGLYVDEL